MPRSKKYENKIPVFYRKSTLDIMMFTHVTAIREYSGVDANGNYTISIEEAINNFFDLYYISLDDYPMESALTTYTRMNHNFLWSEMRRKLDNSNNKN
jgi:hypothetical protein